MKGKLGEGELKLNQWHHAYLGIILIIAGCWPLHSELLRLVGLFVFLDDLLQHTIQYLWDNSYQSPLKYIYAQTLWKWTH